jgi:hypothetical protein
MTHFIFNESGSIAGIPGTFANCRVDIADDGTLTQTPLPVHPAFVASDEPEEAQVETPQEVIAQPAEIAIEVETSPEPATQQEEG